MTEVVFVGVGGAMPVAPADGHTALLVYEDPALILWDCGPGIMRQLENVRVTVGELTHVIVSHQHGDHSLGFPMVLLNRILFWPEGPPLRVLGTAQVLDVLQRLVALVYPDLVARAARLIEYIPLSEEPGPHPLPGSPGISYALAAGQHSVDSWGMRLALSSGPGRQIVYSADTGPSQSIVDLAAGVDILIHEAFYLKEPEEANGNHSIAAEVGRLAQAAGAGQLALIHRMDTTAAAAALYRQAAAEAFTGPILVPMAGDRLSL